jgi:hypothetical protein
MTEKKPKTAADDIKACENSIRSLESQKRNLATRFQGDELARRLKPFDEKLRLRQKKLEELKKGEGDKA